MPQYEDRFQRDFSASPIPTVIWIRKGSEFVFEDANPAAANLSHGLTTEYLGQTASFIYRQRPDMIELLELAWTLQQPLAHSLPVRILVAGRELMLRIDVSPLPPDRVAMHAIDFTAQFEAEERVGSNERRNEILFEQASDGIVRLDDFGRVIEANSVAASMLGYDGAPLTGVHLLDLAQDGEPAPATRGAGETVVSEKTFRRQDGGMARLELSGRSLAGGGLILFLRDLTSRWVREEALRTREQQSWRMIELSPDAICVITQGRIVYVNAAFLRMAGAAGRNDVIGKSVLSFVHPDDRSTVERRLRQTTGTDAASPTTERLVRLDGAMVHVEVAGIPLDYEHQPSVQVMLRDVSERVRQQEALQLSEERYRGLFENSSDVIYRFATDGVVLDVSPAITRLTGWTAEDIRGSQFREFLHPDDVEGALVAFRSTLTNGLTRQLIRVRTRDGKYVTLETINTPEIINGEVVAVFGTARDVTATHAAMEELRASQRLLATVLNRLPVGVAVTDDQGRIVRSNAAGDAIWGFHRTHIALAAPKVYRAWWAHNNQPVKPEEWASSRALHTGQTVLNDLVEIEARDGTRKIIMNSAAPLIDDDGRIHGAVMLNQDVTELRSHEKQREEMATRLREVISSTSDGICTIDTRGRTVLASPAAARMLGVSDEALLGADLDALAHGGPSPAQQNMFTEVMRTGQARPLYQDVFHRRDGPDFDVEVSCAPILIDGEARGAVVTFRDVTRRNVLERELERAQRLSSIGQLAATVAHEFNNVLMGISPFMEVINRRAGNDEQLRSVSDHIQQALHRGKQITREILKFAQAPEPELRPIQLSKLLESSLPELRAIAGPRVRVQITGDPANLATRVDPTQVHQALSNLVSNARDAMKGDGTIEIEAALPEPGEVPQLTPADWIRISVKDHGAGIPPEIRERIFEPLYTTKQAGGTGLGLAVVQQVVTKHGGLIEVDSILGYGTAFRLYFRRCDPPEESTAAESQRSRRAARTILLVEDDENVSAGLAAVLEFEGIDTHVVARGGEAEEAVARLHPDAVVLDRGLPDMDGLEVSRVLLARWPGLPLIFSTGHGGREDIEELAKNPHVAYLLKPYSVSVLLDALDQILPESSSAT